MVLQILQEEYQNVLKEYGMETPYDRDDGAELVVADDYGPLEQISDAVQKMIAKAYQLPPNEDGEYDDIFDVTLEEPPGDDNYMIRIQWNAGSIDSEAPQVIDSDEIE